MKIVRSIAAVVAGFVVAGLIMTIIESINGSVLYPDLGKSAQGVTDREEIRRIFAAAPVGALAVVIFGWALGSFVGGLVATSIGRKPPYRHALVVGALVLVGAVINNWMLPPPLWFWIAGLVVPIPAALAGARVVTRSGSAQAR